MNLFEPPEGVVPLGAPLAEKPLPRPPEVMTTGDLIDALTNRLLRGPEPGQPGTVALVTPLAGRRDPAAVPVLVQLCRRHAGYDTERPVPEVVAALDALTRLGAATALMSLLAEGGFGPATRPLALAGLASLGHGPAAALIAPALADPVPAARLAGCRLAAELGRTDAIPALAALIDDTDRGVAKAAAVALGRLGHAPIRERLEDLLTRATPVDLPVIAAALAPIGTNDTAVLLSRTAERGDESGRLAIAAALGRIATAGAGAGLARLAEDTRPTIRRAVLDALATLEPDTRAPALRRLTQDRDPDIRAAAETLARHQDPDW
jgi:HEAT repeat protein